MSRAPGRVVLAVLGTAVVSTVVGGQYRSYVKGSMGPWLLLTGVVLLLLAVRGALRDRQRHDAERSRLRYGGAPRPAPAVQDGHDGDQHPGQEHGWAWGLLLAPVACLALLAPPPLGSYTAARAVDAATVRPAAVIDEELPAWPPLPAGDVVPLTMGEFVTRAQWDTTRTLAGRTVRLTGFVVPRAAARHGTGGGDWTLARVSIMCCAADATAFRVQVLDPEGRASGRPPAADTWLELEGTWVPAAAPPIAVDAVIPDPVLRLTASRVVRAPADPYE